jgi:DNA-directed RNA polymerase beta subunit
MELWIKSYVVRKFKGERILTIENPIYKVGDLNNHIFNIRQQEYAALLENVRKILIPAEELGFDLTEYRLKEPRFSNGEICKTIKKNLIIRFQKGTAKIDLSMQVPTLVEGNYIVINGRKKIPLFQLFDIPVVTRGKSIKIRTNVATLMIFQQKDAPYIYISILGRKVPLFLIIFGYYGIDVVNERFGLSDMSDSPVITTESTLYERLIYDLKEFYDESRGVTQDDIIKEIGRNYSKFNSKVKGEDIIYAIDLILKTDPISAEFFETDNLLDEIIKTINGGDLDDTDLRNKRIRCLEYVILAKVSKAVFDMCMSNRTARQPKFNINSTQIVSECNVSDIVQFDFAINPIDEATKLSRTSLVGPGGFNRQNVPEHLRDIMPSMFGRLCPVDTPDRDNCGVLQNLIPNVPLDANGRFNEHFLEKQPISIPVSMVPFLEHDDQTRLQMASSQMRQAIMLQNFDQPMIKSGCENLYTKYTQFVKIAKKSGIVIHLDSSYIIALYDDKTIQIFNVTYRKIYISNLDVFNIYVKQGDRFKAGEILAESNFCKNGSINIGKNLLTCVMVYYGYNYEDGIIISDRVQKEGLFTSVHFEDMSFDIPISKVLLTLDKNNDYKPIPKVGDRIAKGTPYAILKEFPNNQMDFFDIFKEERKFLSKQDVIITEVNIYVNQWCTDIPQYNDWVESIIKSQQEDELKIRIIIEENLEKDEVKPFIRQNNLNLFTNTGKFKIKGDEVLGIRVEMFGIFFRPIQIGDKVGNRHGNKGVISTIIPHEKMPMLPDGRHADIIVNPLGTISRMNIGQLFEYHMGMSLWDLRSHMKNIINKEILSTKDFTNIQIQTLVKEYVLGYIKIVDCTDGGWYYSQFEEQLPEEITEEWIDNLSIVQPPFESVNMVKTREALAYSGTQFKYDVFDPQSGQMINQQITCGYGYFFKMVHISETRLAARGIGSYARKTLQPLAGRKNKGGQRCGEMETAALIGHNAKYNLREFLTTKSDCIDLKNRYIRDQLDSDLGRVDDEEGEDSIIPESVKLLNANLIALGLKR